MTEYSLDLDSLEDEKKRILESLDKVKNTLEKLIKVPKGTEKVNPSDFEGIVIYTDLERKINFETNNEKINKLIKNCFWGQCGNF